MFRQALIGSALCVLTLAACHRETGLECPVPQLQSARGDLRETAADIQDYQQRFASGFSEDAISEAIASLRTKYSEAPNDAISNYLTSAYCVNVKKQDVGLSVQKAKLASFEKAVHAVLGD